MKRKLSNNAKQKLKRLTSVGLCISLISIGFVKNVKGTAVFYAISETQERNKWCWVASARGVARGETTVTASQSDGVYAVKNKIINEGGTLEETLTATKFFSPNSDFVTYGTLSFNQIKACIDNGHLVMTLFDPYEHNLVQVGHAMFIIGYNDNESYAQIRYCDVADGETKWYYYDIFNTIATDGGHILEYTNSIFCRLK